MKLILVVFGALIFSSLNTREAHPAPNDPCPVKLDSPNSAAPRKLLIVRLLMHACADVR